MPEEVFLVAETTKEVTSPSAIMAAEVHAELHSEYVQEIVSNRPSLLVRFGNLFFYLSCF